MGVFQSLSRYKLLPSSATLEFAEKADLQRTCHLRCCHEATYSTNSSKYDFGTVGALIQCTTPVRGHHVMPEGFVPYRQLVKVLEIPPLRESFFPLFLILTTILIKEQVRQPFPPPIPWRFAARECIGIAPMHLDDAN